MKRVLLSQRIKQLNKYIENYENDTLWSIKEILIILIVLTLAFLIRSYNISNFIQGALSGDEIFEAHICIKQLINSEKTFRGLSAYTYFILSHIWYSFFGFTAVNLRYMSIFFGIISILFTYLFVRKIYGKSIALIAILFISLSVYHAHFSRIAFDVGNTAAFTMIFLYFYALCLSKISIITSLFAGIFMVLGMAIYPGYFPILPAVFFTLVSIVILNLGLVKSNFKYLSFNHIVMFCAAIFVYMLFYNLHFNILKNTEPMFRGGGSLHLDTKAMAEAFKILMKDLFVKADSWYLGNNSNQSFYEKSLLPFFFIGLILCFLRKYSSKAFAKLTRLKYLSFESIFFISLFVFSLLLLMVSGAYPGARRIIITLPFFYIISGFAIHSLIHTPLYRYSVVAILCILVFSLNTSKFFKETIWWNQKQSITTHDDFLYPLIENLALHSNIILINEEVGTQYSCENYLAYIYLSDYYNKNWRMHSNIYVINKNAELIKKQIGSVKTDQYILITSSPKEDTFLSKIVTGSSIDKGGIKFNQGESLYFYNFKNCNYEKISQ